MAEQDSFTRFIKFRSLKVLLRLDTANFGYHCLLYVRNLPVPDDVLPDAESNTFKRFVSV